MKVVTPKQMAALESAAYEAGHEEEAFMERAGRGVAQAVAEFVEEGGHDSHVTILCGKGNNSGDGYVAGRTLLEIGYRVLVIQSVSIEEASPLCRKNAKRFEEFGGTVVMKPSFPKTGVILDALFGTGFHGAARFPYDRLIEAANQSALPILALDIPSGLNGETGRVSGAVIKATRTIYLGYPKRGFFFNDGWNFVGKLTHVDFGLPKTDVESTLTLIEPDKILPALPKIVPNRHKYQVGVVAALAGSSGMPGAALLTTTAAFRTGAGLVRLLHPKGMEEELSASPYELIKLGYEWGDAEYLLEQLNKANGVCIGPGIGLGVEIKNLLKELLPHIEKPAVVDADALTLIAREGFPFPKISVITPHAGEMRRLLQGADPTIENCKAFVDRKRVSLVLKGGPTFLHFPNDPLTYINPHGDPGMATAGTGDVLTGMIGAFLSQAVRPKEAALLGVYLHSLAGEAAALAMTSTSMIASDLIEQLPHIFQSQASLQSQIELRDPLHPKE